MRGFRKGEILSHLILFAHRLKEKGLKITPGRVMDAARSLEFIDLSNRNDFSSALKANFTSCQEDLTIYDELFEEFWVQIQEVLQKRATPAVEEPGDEGTPREEIDLLSEDEEEPAEEEGVKGEKLQVGYSAEEVLMVKDFSQFGPEDWEILDQEFARLLSQLAMRVSRRREPSAKGREMDFRRTFRRTMHYGGEILELVRRRRKIKPLKVIVICDVSGSMDPSTRFILQSIFGLQRIFRQSEIFVFSTRLTRITDILKRHRWAEALLAISRQVQDWSGGTKIGHCLKMFNERYARDLGIGGAAVILISDGWDRGDTGLLDFEMRRLKRGARRIIWMNPLLGSPDYQPICQGMRTALPYLDDFLPATNLKGLKALGDILVEM
ncbi:MAG: VWA domain-containing protein [Deltaproteobacteria bacterium]|nr:VWA domain-containing protein [Deltaproteobacteria bacterium]